MSIIITSQNQANYQKATDALVLQSGDDVVLNAGAKIWSTGAKGIFGISGNKLTLSGTVQSDPSIAIFLTAGGHTITLQGTADIKGTAGIDIGAGKNTVTNYGLVTGTTSYGMSVAGSDNTISGT